MYRMKYKLNLDMHLMHLLFQVFIFTYLYTQNLFRFIDSLVNPFARRYIFWRMTGWIKRL